MSEEQRMRSAYSEAIERDTLFSLREDLISPYVEDERFVAPYSRENFLANTQSLEWVWFQRADGRKALLHRPTRLSKLPSLYRHTSTGIAVHTSPQLAFDFALNEIIERNGIAEFFLRERGCKKLTQQINSNDIITATMKSGWHPEWYSIENKGNTIMLCMIRNVSDKRFLIGSTCLGSKLGKTSDLSKEGSFLEAFQVLEAALLQPNLSYLAESQRRLFNPDGISTLERLFLEKNITIDTPDKSDGDLFFRHPWARAIQISDLSYCELIIPSLNNSVDAKNIPNKYDFF